MAPKIDRIATIGEEGFELIEKHFYAGPGQVHSLHHQTQYRRTNHHAEQQPCVYYCPRTATVTVKVPVATEATRYFYSGSNQPAAREEQQPPPVMTCDEAAQKFGGLVITDRGSRRRSSSSQLGF